MSKFLQRVITGLVLWVVIVVVFFRLPPAASAALLGMFVIMAAWEWAGFLGQERARGRLAYTVVIVALMLAAVSLVPERVRIGGLLWGTLLWWGVAFIWVLRYPTPIRLDVGAVCGALVLVPPWIALVVLLYGSEQGPALALLALAIVGAADIGAYFVGRRFGRVRLAPRVSPGKTWEGVIGGLISAACTAAAGAWLLNLPVGFMVPLGLSVAAFSIVGDLTVSMFKRNAGLKDSGQLFPGHGGVLDRIDSGTAGVPLYLLGLIWLGLIPV